MIIQLFDTTGQDQPSHEFTITSELNHVRPDSILHYAPTGNYYIYFSRSKGVWRFRKAELVTINVAVS